MVEKEKEIKEFVKYLYKGAFGMYIHTHQYTEYYIVEFSYKDEDIIWSTNLKFKDDSFEIENINKKYLIWKRKKKLENLNNF